MVAVPAAAALGFEVSLGRDSGRGLSSRHFQLGFASGCLSRFRSLPPSLSLLLSPLSFLSLFLCIWPFMSPCLDVLSCKLPLGLIVLSLSRYARRCLFV